MFKKVFTLLLLFLVLLVSPVLAEQDIPDKDIPDKDISIHETVDEEKQVVRDEDEGGWVDKMLAAPINGAVKALRALGLKDLDTLLFNKGVKDYVIPPFCDQSSWDNITKWYRTFYYAAFGLVFIGLFYTGAKIAFIAYTPKKREEAMKGLSRFLYAFLIIAAAPLMIQFFLQINNAGVEMMADIAGDLGVLKDFQTNSDGAGGDFITNLYTGHVLTTAIVKLAMVGLMVYFNVLYLVRALVLAGLMALTPLLIWLWAITSNELAFKIWFGEIISVTFMQMLHAFSLLFFLSFVGSLDIWWAIIVALFMIIPFTKILRNIFQGFLRFLGIDEEGLAAGQLGMLGGLALMGKATVGRGKVGSSASVGIAGGTASSNSNTGGAFGIINTSGQPQAHGSLATLSKISPAITKVAGVIGAGVGLSMAAPLLGVNPGMAATVGGAGRSVASGLTGISARSTALGAMTAKNIFQTGSLSEGLIKTATVQTPIDFSRVEGYAGGTHEEKAPETSGEAAMGLLGAAINPNTAQGYEQGQNLYRSLSGTSLSRTAENDPRDGGADPMQWRT